MGCIVATARGDQSLRSELFAVVSAEQRHQMRTMLGEVTGWHTPRWPWLAGVLIQLAGLAGGRAHSVTAHHHDKLQLLVFSHATRRRVGVLRLEGKRCRHKDAKNSVPNSTRRAMHI
jgi:hypothetical protein